jgi:hypothetical protein
MMARLGPALFWQLWQMTAFPSASRKRCKSGGWSSSLFFLLWQRSAGCRRKHSS